MAKTRSFVGFLASLFIMLFTANSFAASAYTCDTKTYTSCKAGYYLSSGDCEQCPTNSSSTNGATSCTCNTGYNVGGTRGTGTTTATNPASCTAAIYKVTLDNQSATTAGTAQYYYRYKTKGTCYYYTTNALTTCIDSSDGQKITAPTRTGYTFGGYYTGKNGEGTQYVKADGTTTGNIYSTIAADTKLYAKWTAKSYTISYVLNNGTQAPSGVPTSYTYGTSTTINGVPTRPGYTFYGWCTNSALTASTCSKTQTISATDTDNRTFYAKWIANPQYTISYELNGGTQDTTASKAPTTYTQGIGADITAVPKRTGYNFVGWCTSSALTASTCSKTQNISADDTGNKTFYAKWEGITILAELFGNTSEREYDTGTYRGTIVYTYGTNSYHPEDLRAGSITSIADTGYFPVRNGYTFNGYILPLSQNTGITVETNKEYCKYINKSGNFVADTNCTPSQLYNVYSSGGEVMLFAQWIRLVTVTLNNGNFSNMKSYIDKYYYEYNKHDKCYYYTNDELTTCIKSPNYSDNTGIYIQTPTRTGYKFDGYYYGTTQYVDADGKTVGDLYKNRDSDITLTAKWTVKTYNLTYHLDGGTQAPSGVPTSYTYGTSTTINGVPTRPGYYFTGWKKSESGTCSTTLEITSTNVGNFDIYACWAGCPSGYSANAGAITSQSACVANCTTSDVSNSSAVTGTKTYGGVKNCAATSCTNEYSLSNGQCTRTHFTATFVCGSGATGKPEYETETAIYNAALMMPDVGECQYPGYRLVGWRAQSYDPSVIEPHDVIEQYPYEGDMTFEGVWERASCDANQYLDGTTCKSCPDDFPMSDSGATNINYCYANCTIDLMPIPHATKLTGTMFFESTDSCKPTECEDGYEVKNYECSAKTYKITYTAGTGGLGDDQTQSVTYDTSFTTKAADTFSKRYATFAGWSATWTLPLLKDLPIDIDTYPNANTTYRYTSTGDVTLTAQWNCNAGYTLNRSTGACDPCGTGHYKNAPGNGSCTPCAMGSYQDTKGQSSCKSCPTLTSGYWYDGSIGLDAVTECIEQTDTSTSNSPIGECSAGALYRYATNATTWGNATVTVALQAKTNYFVDNTKNTCTKCPTNSTSSGGNVTFCTCNTGHSATGTPNGSKTTVKLRCSPITYPIEYVLNDGTQAESGVPTSYTYGAGATINGTPTKTNYEFLGWCTDSGLTNCAMTQTIAADATDTKTFYAKWKLSVTQCQLGKYYDGTNHVNCPSGKYCPGPDVIANSLIGTPGCFSECPSDTKNGTLSSDGDRTLKTNCASTYSNTAVTGGAGDKTCHYDTASNTYSIGCTINVTKCNAGYYKSAADSPTCTQVPKGQFSAANETAVHKCSDLRASGDTREVTTSGIGQGIGATSCYAICPEQRLTDAKGNHSGTIASAQKTYVNTTTKYPACPTIPVCNTGYTVDGLQCTPDIYTITLNHNGGSSTVNTIYLEYNNGWFSDSIATKALTSVPVPSNTNTTKKFSGYRMQNTAKTTIVDASGMLLTTTDALTATLVNATAQAQFDDREQIVCDKTTYYPGTGGKENCRECPAGSYCPGGITAYKNSEEEAGKRSCKDLVSGYTTATSSAGAGSNADCYVTGLVYEADYTTGTQTCYYNGLGSFSAKCKDIKVTKCDAGYWLENKTSGKQCAAVGKGYYSAKDSLDKKACPNLNDKLGVTTQFDTSSSVEACYIPGMWYEDHSTIHGAQRRSCYHVANENNTDPTTGYSTNCLVGTIVACDGGYYRARQDAAVCTAITDKNKYSPAQSAFYPAEPLQPTADAPGSSINILDCPYTKTLKIGDLTVGTATRVLKTIDDYAVCTYENVVCNGDGYNAITGEDPMCTMDDPDACPRGYYCSDDNDKQPVKCPNGGTSDLGSKKITDCYKEYDAQHTTWKYGSGSSKCKYETTTRDYTACSGTVESCDRGYYYKDQGSLQCVEVDNGFYSPAANTGQTQCPAGGNGSTAKADDVTDCYKNCSKTMAQVSHATSLGATALTVSAKDVNTYNACQYNIECATGYTVKNNGTENPTCAANTYTVTLNKNGGQGDVAASVQCTFDTPCMLPAITGHLTRDGYTAGTKWCTAQNGTGRCFTAGASIIDNISETGNNITLYAEWGANTYKVTLNHNGGTGVGLRDTAYVKYATGWFSDSDAKLPLAKLTVLPAKIGYEFAGYKSGNQSIVNANGEFLKDEATLTFTANAADITAAWSAGNTTCEKGNYYAGTGSTCLPCHDNNYCPGGSFATDGGKEGEFLCPDGGKTAVNASASSAEQCFKENLNTYRAAHGNGTQACYYNDTEKKYNRACFNGVINECDSGYWRGEVAMPADCIAVGRGHYSVAPTGRMQCPNGGTTAEGETTASSISRCYKTELDYEATYGTGTQRCYYTTGEGNAAIYNTECDTRKITACRGGYWLDISKTATDCSPVGPGSYSNPDDIELHSCPNNGKTNSDTTATVGSCYITSAQYTAEHGGGYQTCYYNEASGRYNTGCETPTFEYCAGGYYYDVTQNDKDCIEVGYGAWSPTATVTSSPSVKAPSLNRNKCNSGETTEGPTSVSAAACITCPAGKVCDPDSPAKPKTCSELTGGKYPNSDAGVTVKDVCWRECAITPHAATMKGRDYYGIESTCDVDHCIAGYTYNATTHSCEPCPDGMFCGGGDKNCPAGHNCGEPVACADLGDGSWPYSEPGANDPSKCYAKCEEYPLVGGKAVPVHATEFYDTKCEYKGFDFVDNPCKIQDGKCIPSSCKPSYEMVNGACKPCNREHALGYLDTGNCMVSSCTSGWHPYAQSCEPDVIECEIDNATRAEQRWDYKKNAYGACIIQECDEGMHISANVCVPDIRTCQVEHGIGEQEWNTKTKSWGECIATSCDPGWTNDLAESNEPTKQCGHCRNKFAVNGELAASSYSRGCTISACMYQGEMYNLENNECNPICDVNGYEDETGTMKWNPSTHKCERKCKSGYVMW